MPKITNEYYREFLDKGSIRIMEPIEFHRLLDTMKFESHKFKQAEWQNYLYLLYWSGRRPTEILRLKGEDIKKDKGYIVIMFPTLKKGRTTNFYFSCKLVQDIKKVYKWAKSRHPSLLLFPSLISQNTKEIKWKKKNGEIIKKSYKEPASNIFYYVKKFFRVPPYFFRHNRFSDMMMKGADIYDIQHAKGGKDVRSVSPYLHLSKKAAKKTAKFIK